MTKAKWDGERNEVLGDPALEVQNDMTKKARAFDRAFNDPDLIKATNEARNGPTIPLDVAIAALEENEYIQLGVEIGALVESKQKQYGNSVDRSDQIMAVLYPNGISISQYRDALLVVRVIDKLSRIAQRGEDGQDLGGESPWKDLAGYGILGWRKDRQIEESSPETEKG